MHLKAFLTEMVSTHTYKAIKSMLWSVDVLHRYAMPPLPPPSHLVGDLKDFLKEKEKCAVKKPARRAVGLTMEHISWHAAEVQAGDLAGIRDNLLYKALYGTISRSEWLLPKAITGNSGYNPLRDLTAADVIPHIVYDDATNTTTVKGIHWGSKHTKSDAPGNNLDASGRDWHYTPAIPGHPSDIVFTFMAYFDLMEPYLRDPDAPFFQQVDDLTNSPNGLPYTYGNALHRLRTNFENCPLLQVNDFLGLHGWRRGGATDMLRLTNVSPEDLKRMMRIKSDAYQIYNELSNSNIRDYQFTVAQAYASTRSTGEGRVGVLPSAPRSASNAATIPRQQ